MNSSRECSQNDFDTRFERIAGCSPSEWERRAMARMTIDRAAEEQLRRLLRGVVQCDEAKAVPRRLGGDATDQELANDKRMCRRVRHRLLTCAEDWARELDQYPIELPKGNGSGARIQWPVWWSEWRAEADKWLQWFEDRDSHMKYIHRVKREIEGLEQVFA